jgi:hypothetical protein
MIKSGCETVDRVTDEFRNSYLGAPRGTNLGPALDKTMATKEQEDLLAAAPTYAGGQRHSALSIVSVGNKYAVTFPKKIVLLHLFCFTI